MPARLSTGSQVSFSDDTKDGSKLFVALRTLGASLSNSANGKASSETSALKPYWGKLAVRNFRGGYGNGGIIRSPLSAITLLDYSSAACNCGRAVSLPEALSVNDLSSFTPSSWRSVFWSRLLTLMYPTLFSCLFAAVILTSQTKCLFRLQTFCEICQENSKPTLDRRK